MALASLARLVDPVPRVADQGDVTSVEVITVVYILQEGFVSVVVCKAV